MSTYVMSDLHGEYDKFIQMLTKIGFSNDDKLIIIGDIFDRGEKPLQILDYILNKDNIELLLGNHELMFMEAYNGYGVKNWIHYNGGNTTFKAMAKRGDKYMEMLYKYLEKLDIVKVIDNYILVHAGFYMPRNYKDLTIDELLKQQTIDYNLWNRDWINNPKKLDNYTIIVGHTPAFFIDDGAPKINYLNGHICIDCGATFNGGKLACLRLDDLQEFYI